MNDNPYETPKTEGHSLPTIPKRPSLLAKFVKWTSIGGVVLILIAAMLPAVTRSRPGGGRRSQCLNNHNQIGKALHVYHVEHKSLPPAYSVDAEGKPLHSWRTLLLPYIDRKDIYERLDLSKPWNDPANLAVFKGTHIGVYSCPSALVEPTDTTYLAVSTPESAFPGAKPRSFDDMKDGPANIVWLVDMPKNYAVPWYEPRDADAAMLLELKHKMKDLSHPGGVTISLADASSRFFPATTSDEIWRRMIDIDDGEPVELP